MQPHPSPLRCGQVTAKELHDIYLQHAQEIAKPIIQLCDALKEGGLQIKAIDQVKMWTCGRPGG
jgi:hypothetical protein